MIFTKEEFLEMVKVVDREMKKNKTVLKEYGVPDKSIKRRVSGDG